MERERWGRREQETERLILFICSLSKCLQWLRLGQVNSWTQSLHPRCPHGYRDSSTWVCCCCFFSCISRGLYQKWSGEDSGVPGSDLTGPTGIAFTCFNWKESIPLPSDYCIIPLVSLRGCRTLKTKAAPVFLIESSPHQHSCGNTSMHTCSSLQLEWSQFDHMPWTGLPSYSISSLGTVEEEKESKVQ